MMLQACLTCTAAAMGALGCQVVAMVCHARSTTSAAWELLMAQRIQSSL
jgi:hypothetical protein